MAELKIIIEGDNAAGQPLQAAGDDVRELGQVSKSASEDTSALAESLEQAGVAAADYSKAASEAAEETEGIGDSAEDAGEGVRSGIGGGMGNARMAMKAFNLVAGATKVVLSEVYSTANKMGRTEVVKAFDDARDAGESLKQTLFSLPIGGQDVLSWFQHAAEGATNLANLVGALAIQFQLMTGQISQENAEMQINALLTNQQGQAAADAAAQNQQFSAAMSLLQTELSGPLKSAFADHAQQLGDVRQRQSELQTVIDQLAGKRYLTDQQKEDLAAAKKEFGELAGKVGEVKGALEDQIEALIVSTLTAQAKSPEQVAAVTAIATHFGLVDEAAGKVVTGTLKIWEIFDEGEGSREGMIEALDKLVTSAETFGTAAGNVVAPTDAASEAILGIRSEILLAESKEITFTTNMVTNYSQTGTPGGGGPNPEDRAGGGDVDAGSIYRWQERGDEFFIPSTDGFVMNATDVSRMLSSLEALSRGGGGNGGGSKIYVDARGATDPRAVEEAGYRGAKRALDETARADDERRRTGARRS